MNPFVTVVAAVLAVHPGAAHEAKQPSTFEVGQAQQATAPPLGEVVADAEGVSGARDGVEQVRPTSPDDIAIAPDVPIPTVAQCVLPDGSVFDTGAGYDLPPTITCVDTGRAAPTMNTGHVDPGPVYIVDPVTGELLSVEGQP